MKRTLIYILPIILLILMVACPKGQSMLNLRNNSDKEIVICAAFIFPETYLPDKENVSRLIFLGPHKVSTMFDFDINDEDFRRLATEKLTIFFIDKVVYETYTWEDIQKDNLILKYIEITVEDYNNTKGWIEYP